MSAANFINIAIANRTVASKSSHQKITFTLELEHGLLWILKKPASLSMFICEHQFSPPYIYRRIGPSQFKNRNRNSVQNERHLQASSCRRLIRRRQNVWQSSHWVTLNKVSHLGLTASFNTTIGLLLILTNHSMRSREVQYCERFRSRVGTSDVLDPPCRNPS